mgnify:CR=1 FL=1
MIIFTIRTEEKDNFWVISIKFESIFGLISTLKNAVQGKLSFQNISNLAIPCLTFWLDSSGEIIFLYFVCVEKFNIELSSFQIVFQNLSFTKTVRVDFELFLASIIDFDRLKSSFNALSG